MACAILVAAACGGAGTQATGEKRYGDSFDTAKPMEINAAVTAFKTKGEKDAVVTGEISAVCQAEGCWFNYQTNDGELFVDFNHKFEIPKDTKGRTAIAKGQFQYDTTTVEMLKEYAKDDKKTQAEIDAIKEPEIRMVFTAAGVMLKSK